MEQRKVKFISSAFRHNFTAADIRWVLDNNLAGGVVFHAMKCRKKWRIKLGMEE
jgi:hypothetical protein